MNDSIIEKKHFGFTLIELLSVIAILGIIILILTPIISNTVNDSKKRSGEISASEVLNAAKMYYTNAITDSNLKLTLNGRTNVLSSLHISGDMPNPGIVYINGQGKIAVSLIYDEYCYMKNFEETELTVSRRLDTCSTIQTIGE